MSSPSHSHEEYKKALRETTIVFAPSQLISVFGETNYNYCLLSARNEKTTIVREGVLHVLKPMVITMPSENNFFSGFPPAAKEKFKELLQAMGVKFEALEYQFKLIPREQWEEKAPVSVMVTEIKQAFQKQASTALLIGKEPTWEVSLLKLCFKVVENSTVANLKELMKKNKPATSPSLREKTETLFKAVWQKKKALNELARFLLENQLFERYEERFFALVKKLKT